MVALKLPLMSNTCVAVTVQFVSGVATFVLLKILYTAFANPLFPLRITFDPLTTMFVMTGFGSGSVVSGSAADMFVPTSNDALLELGSAAL